MRNESEKLCEAESLNPRSEKMKTTTKEYLQMPSSLL
jgi:hypothetical protein